MTTENNSEKELNKLKSQIEYERVRAQNLADRAEWEAKLQKDKSTTTLAIVSLLLFLSVVIILGLTGVFS